MSSNSSNRTYDTTWLPYMGSAVEAVLLLMHISVFACVANSILKKVHYASGAFFKVFLMKGVADYIAYSIVSTMREEQKAVKRSGCREPAYGDSTKWDCSRESTGLRYCGRSTSS